MTNSSENLYGRRSNPLLTVPMAIVLVVLTAATGYLVLGERHHQAWGFADCLYMAVISLTTVGYGEVLPHFAETPHARTFNSVVLVLGYGVMLWAFSTLIAAAVEGRLGERLLRRRMMHQIDALSGHFLVCGLGHTGEHVVEELLHTGRRVVAVDRDRERLAAVCGEGRCLFVEGDAEQDAVLKAAGIERAAGLVACLPSDKDNLYVLLSARQLNPRLRLVARAYQDESHDKLRRAGADAVVAPSMIGGLRLASELVRPHVTGFLDIMLRDTDRNIRMEEVTVPAGSPFVDKALKEADVQRRTGLLVVATKAPGHHDYTYNPAASHVLTAGMVLIVLGETAKIASLKALLQVAGATP